jgi:hypothetical protein
VIDRGPAGPLGVLHIGRRAAEVGTRPSVAPWVIVALVLLLVAPMVAARLSRARARA